MSLDNIITFFNMYVKTLNVIHFKMNEVKFNKHNI